MIQKTSDKIIDFFNIAVMIIASLVCLFPFINVIATSLSSSNAITSGKVTFIPIEFNLDFYKKVLPDPSMLQSLKFTIYLTIVYVFLALLVTIFAAYPLSRKRLRGRKTLTIIVTLTMYFSGGMVPSFLIVQKLHLLDTIWSLILPGLINTYYLIIMKSFFTSIPESLTEAAIIDGCTEIGVLFKIVLPLSMPVLATMALFYAVQRWNSFQDALFYITSPERNPLQLKLRAIVLANQVNDRSDAEAMKQALNTEGLKAATLVYATVPILIVYPWLQKYFVKGMTIGAVKE